MGLVCVAVCALQALLLDRSAFHSLLGKLDSLRSMWRFEVRAASPCLAAGKCAPGGAVEDKRGSSCWCCKVSCKASIAASWVPTCTKRNGFVGVCTARLMALHHGVVPSVPLPPQALQRVPLFAGLDPKTKGAIASALGQVSMPKGTAVVTQGERGHAFYIVESGQLSAFKDNSPLPVLSYGPGAKHQALLN